MFIVIKDILSAYDNKEKELKTCAGIGLKAQTKSPAFRAGLFKFLSKCYFAAEVFAISTSCLKDTGSLIAISDNIFLLRVIFAFVKPLMKVE